MKNEADFARFGKKIPYKVPEGFFGDITEKTIELASQRKKKHKIRLGRISFAMAATFLLLVTIGYFLMRTDPAKEEFAKTDGPEKTNTEWNGIEEPAPLPASIGKTETVAEPAGTKTQTNVHAEKNRDEELGNILASLTNEELKFFAGIISEELTIDEIQNN